MKNMKKSMKKYIKKATNIKKKKKKNVALARSPSARVSKGNSL